MEAAVGGLSEADRDAIVLRFYCGYSLRDVGASLHITEDAARKRVARAVRRLRQSLQRRGLGATAWRFLRQEAVSREPSSLDVPALQRRLAALIPGRGLPGFRRTAGFGRVLKRTANVLRSRWWLLPVTGAILCLVASWKLATGPLLVTPAAESVAGAFRARLAASAAIRARLPEEARTVSAWKVVAVPVSRNVARNDRLTDQITLPALAFEGADLGDVIEELNRQVARGMQQSGLRDEESLLICSAAVPPPFDDVSAGPLPRALRISLTHPQASSSLRTVLDLVAAHASEPLRWSAGENAITLAPVRTPRLVHRILEIAPSALGDPTNVDADNDAPSAFASIRMPPPFLRAARLDWPPPFRTGFDRRRNTLFVQGTPDQVAQVVDAVRAAGAESTPPRIGVAIRASLVRLSAAAAEASTVLPCDPGADRTVRTTDAYRDWLRQTANCEDIVFFELNAESAPDGVATTFWGSLGRDSRGRVSAALTVTPDLAADGETFLLRVSGRFESRGLATLPPDSDALPTRPAPTEFVARCTDAEVVVVPLAGLVSGVGTTAEHRDYLVLECARTEPSPVLSYSETE